MKTYQRILVIARPHLHRSPALLSAARLARPGATSLHLIVFDHRATFDGDARLRDEDMPRMREIFLRRRHDWLVEQAGPLRAQGIEVTTEAVWSAQAADEVLARVLTGAVDLVVKDVDRPSAAAMPRMSPLDWQLIRGCPVPVMLVQDERESSHCVAAAVDVVAGSGDRFNDKLMREADAIARLTGAERHLVHVLDVTASDAAPTTAPLFAAGIYDAVRERHQQTFVAFAARHEVPEVQRRFVAGPTAMALSRYIAESGVDLLVIGANHHRRRRHIVIGRNAACLLDELPCNILVIKSDSVEKSLGASLAAQQTGAGDASPSPEHNTLTTRKSRWLHITAPN